MRHRHVLQIQTADYSDGTAVEVNLVRRVPGRSPKRVLLNLLNDIPSDPVALGPVVCRTFSYLTTSRSSKEKKKSKVRELQVKVSAA